MRRARARRGQTKARDEGRRTRRVRVAAASLHHDRRNPRIEQVPFLHGPEHVAEAELAQRRERDSHAVRARFGEDALAGPAGGEQRLERERRRGAIAALDGEAIEEERELAAAIEGDALAVRRAKPQG